MKTYGYRLAGAGVESIVNIVTKTSCAICYNCYRGIATSVFNFPYLGPFKFKYLRLDINHWPNESASNNIIMGAK